MNSEEDLTGHEDVNASKHLAFLLFQPHHAPGAVRTPVLPARNASGAGRVATAAHPLSLSQRPGAGQSLSQRGNTALAVRVQQGLDRPRSQAALGIVSPARAGLLQCHAHQAVQAGTGGGCNAL